MSQHISRAEWGRIAASVDGHTQYTNAQQQRLFRLFQALRSGNMGGAQEMVLDGVPLDIPFILDSSPGTGGVPRAEQFRFEELDGIRDVTALGWAAGRGELDEVKWLLKNHASVFSLFADGRDAAWVAMEMGQNDLMDFLLRQGVPVNHRMRDPMESSRLIAATRQSNPDAVRYLLEHKAKVGLYDKRGRTALHYNFEKDPYTQEDAEIGRMLIDWGGNPAAVDVENNAAADLAHTDLQYALLRQHGLERRLPKVVEPKIEEPAPEPAGEFDHRNIIRPEVGDPGLPQLNKPPVFKKPRF